MRKIIAKKNNYKNKHMAPEIEFLSSPHPLPEECTLLPFDIGKSGDFSVFIHGELFFVALGTKAQIDSLIEAFSVYEEDDNGHSLDKSFIPVYLPAEGMAYYHYDSTLNLDTLKGPELELETLMMSYTPEVIESLQPERFYKWKPKESSGAISRLWDFALPLSSGNIIYSQPAGHSTVYGILSIEEFIENGLRVELDESHDYEENEEE